RIPFATIGFEQQRALDAQRHRIAKLVDGGLGTQREHGRAATMLFDEAHRLLDRAFLVRADREPQIAGVDLLAVRGQGNLTGRRGNALDADEDVHGGRESAPDAEVLWIEERRRTSERDRRWIAFAEVFDGEPGPKPRLLRREEAHHDGLADRWARPGAR